MRRLLFLLGFFLVVGCSKQEGGTVTVSPSASPAGQATPAKKLLVMATIAPMYCFTKNVAGDLADVEMIVPEGGGPWAGFKLSQDKVNRILQADVVVENGFGFESWMDQLVEQNPMLVKRRVIAARGTGPGIPGLPGDPNTPPGGAVPDELGRPPDPHVWLDPIMAIKEVQNIRDALMARDPANADQYLANENAYEAKLRDLDDEVGRETVDIAKRRLVCWDKTFLYFLSRYEFTVVDVLSTVTASSAHTREWVDAVLASAGVDAGTLNKSGLPVVLADPMESGSASTDFYEKATLANVRALREGLMR